MLNDETSHGATAVVRDAGITEPVGYIARLLVDPSVRRTGIGRDLLAHALAAAIADGLVPVLDVVADARKAIALYESTGWVRIGSADLALPDGTSITEHVYRGPDRPDRPWRTAGASELGERHDLAASASTAAPVTCGAPPNGCSAPSRSIT